MNNLKVKVRAETKEQSDEIQKLANSIGIFRPYNTWALHKGWVCIEGKEMLLVCDSCPGGEDEFKTITLPELRDMVVLKRNDKNDRNVVDPEYEGANLYLDSKNDLFVFHIPTQAWKESNLNHEQEVLARLKPIEKTMKEYLIKTEEGKYHYINDSYDTCPAYVEKIEIPKVSQFAVLNGDNEINFYTGIGLEKNHFISDAIVWQRSTQPEELPFIDDEPQSLNNQYDEIEQVRQQAIEATLKERGSRYGDFKDVADTTQKLMATLMGNTGYSSVQVEALHMICSKLARIANGDPNYRDNWHDISGYAKLVEDTLD